MTSCLSFDRFLVEVKKHMMMRTLDPTMTDGKSLAPSDDE